jgi:hypothetical protein
MRGKEQVATNMAVPSRGVHTNTNKRMDLTALASAFVRILRILITNTLTASVRTVEFSESVNCYESLSIPNPRAAHVLKLQKESHLALGNDIQEQVLDLDLSQQSYYQYIIKSPSRIIVQNLRWSPGLCNT